MSDAIEKMAAARQPPSGSGAERVNFGALAAAFGVASCCALPLLLTTIGESTAWLGGVALLWREQRAASICGPNDTCTPPTVRVLTLVGLLIGAGLLWAGYVYA